MGLPTFRAPEPEPEPLPAPSPTPMTSSNPQGEPLPLDTPTQPRPATATLHADDASDGSTRTGIWGTRVPTAAETKTTVKMVQGVSKVLMVLSDALLGRAGRQLRRPTPEQLADFSEPIGAIVARHLDVSKLGLDVADLTTAGGAFGDWLSEGPVTLPKGPNVVQVGMPEPDPFSAPEQQIPGQMTTADTDLPDLSGPITYLN